MNRNNKYSINSNEFMLLDLLNQGKIEGMNRLYDVYFTKMVSIAYLYLDNRTEAEDLVQEQFIKFWQRQCFKQITTEERLYNFLYTMVKNAAMDMLKKTHCVSLDTLNTDIIEIQEKVIEDLDEERINEIYSLYEQLPPKTKQTLEYVILKGMKYRDAALALGVSIETIKSQLKYGIKKIRANLPSSLMDENNLPGILLQVITCKKEVLFCSPSL